MADTHEVYPSAPLALVAVEVRFPEAAAVQPLPITVQRSFRDLLGEGWVIESIKAQKVEFDLLPQGGSQTVQHLTIPRFTVRDRTLAVAVTEESLTVETTRYRHYPDFRAVVERALTAAAQVLLPDGVARVGLRYIDEIRSPGVRADHPSDWQPWIDPSLLAPQITAMEGEGFNPAAWEGAVQYETGPGQKLVLRYGPRTGYAVNPAGPLKRHSPPPAGALFLLDFDCFWEPTDIPEFDPAVLLATCDQLRTPIRALFDLLISDKLRKEVFMKEPANG